MTTVNKQNKTKAGTPADAVSKIAAANAKTKELLAKAKETSATATKKPVQTAKATEQKKPAVIIQKVVSKEKPGRFTTEELEALLDAAKGKEADKPVLKSALERLAAKIALRKAGKKD